MFRLKSSFLHSIHLPNLWEEPVIRLLFSLAIAVLLATSYGDSPRAASVGPGVGNIPQGTQTDDSFRNSFATNHVTNVFATTQQVSCYTPEVPYTVNDGPVDWYSGQTPCNGAATTGEDLGPYATQQGSNAGFPAPAPVLVNNHSESDIQVDPTNPRHLIGSTKWFASAEGYNHVLGFYESSDGGKTWPVQGHIPGYEGWTDNTDPVGAFDRFGNYYELILPYQFDYKPDGSKQFNTGQEPNPSVSNEAISVAVRPHGATSARQWITTHNGQPDIVFATNAGFGQEPDKQWIAIDNNPASPFYNTIYAMWVNFNGFGSKPFYSTAKALPDGTHTDWTTPLLLPVLDSKQNNTDLLPHVAPSGVVWTTVDQFPGKKGQCCVTHTVDFSTDGGATWRGPLVISSTIQTPPFPGPGYSNTTFRDGIAITFGVGRQLVAGHYPLYAAWEDFSTGFDNIILSASFDDGQSWASPPIQVNDNLNPSTDEFQPNLATAADGTVSVNFYDRRLKCPDRGTTEAVAAGLSRDTVNPNYSGSLPPYSAANYCVNAAIQFYRADLTPIGHNIRLTAHTWDPQLNGPHPGTASNNDYTFIGDYFGNATAGSTNYATFVSTYDDGSNPNHYQQQVVASMQIPKP